MATTPKSGSSAERSATTAQVAQTAFRLVLIVGIVNLFADMTYEGGRSVAGPFLASLGASATIVGFTSGFGELAGYGLRSITGYLADRTRQYWAFAFAGYAVNMLAVPAFALAGNWPLAAALIVAERTGRAIRKPGMDAMLSHAGHIMGHGWVFGLNEALDQAGATLGPLIVAFVLYRRGSYQNAFAVLLISALLCLAVLFLAWFLYRRPEEMSRAWKRLAPESNGVSKSYWLYVGAGALIAAGFADFSLIAFHFHENASVAQGVVPVFYAVAMASGAVSALVLGRMLDACGLPVLVVAFCIPAFFAPFAFFGNAALEFFGVVLWGIGLGAQDSCLKAVLSRVVAGDRRGTAFGRFDTVFGIAWFAGSALMGWLYDRSLPAVVTMSVVLQLAAVPVLVAAKRQEEGTAL